RGTVEKVPGFELILAESLDGHTDVLFLAARIGKAEIHEFDVFIFDGLEYLFWGHIFPLGKRATAQHGQIWSLISELENFVTSSSWLVRRCTGRKCYGVE